MKTGFFSLLLCTLLCEVQAQTYIVHANLVDVNTQTIHSDYTVVLRGDTIEAVQPSNRIRPEKGANIIDATGKWVMPGLVDAHVHFFQTGGLYTRPDALDLRKYYPYEKELAWYKEHMGQQLRRYLSCGITTVIDDGATLGLLKQRDSFAMKADAPRILMAGPLISTAYSPAPFEMLRDPDKPVYPVSTPAEAVKMTQRQYDSRPDFIKIWYIVIDPDKAKGAQNNLPMVKAAIEEAHRNHYRIAVHATEQVTAQLAVEAGADFLVHQIEDEIVDDSFIQLLKQRHVIICPTLTVIAGYFDTFSQNYIPTAEDIAKGDPEQLASLQELHYLPDTSIVKRYKQLAAMRGQSEKRKDSVRYINLKKMQDAGVIIATGTDAGNIGTLHAASFFKELRAMSHAGLSNWQILVASTLNGARAMNRENEFGSISRGKTADLLMLDANPVQDLANLERIVRVFRKGVGFSPDSLLPSSPVDIVQRQVNAYNARDLETFLSFYSDTATLYKFPAALIARGKEEMRKVYSFLNNAPGLHVIITNRTVMGNKVTDHEVVMKYDQKIAEGLATYFVEGGKIYKVLFVKDTDR